MAAVSQLWDLDAEERKEMVQNSESVEWLIRSIRSASRRQQIDREFIACANRRVQELREDDND